MLPAGPLWLGGVQDQAVIRAMKEALPGMKLNTARHLATLLDLLGEELPTSSHYDYHALAKRAKVSPPPVEEVICSLREHGYQASRAHYSGTALKTDAPAREIISVIARYHRKENDRELAVQE